MYCCIGWDSGPAGASVPKPTVRTVRSDEGNFPKKVSLRESDGEASRSFKLLCVIMLRLETLFSGKSFMHGLCTTPDENGAALRYAGGPRRCPDVGETLVP
jgi:hypothetical protein